MKTTDFDWNPQEKCGFTRNPQFSHHIQFSARNERPLAEDINPQYLCLIVHRLNERLSKANEGGVDDIHNEDNL